VKPIERRLVSAPVEVRATEGAAPVVSGYAAVYETEAIIAGMFRERIAKGAFRSVIAAAPDVRALFKHDDNLVLGRTTNGTLRLSEDERGLRYEFDPNPDDTDAARVVAKIKRGDVSQSSYGFRVADGGDEWTKPTTRGELPLRTIVKFDVLRDVSPVTFPAFEDTTAEARSAARAAMTADPEEAEEAGEALQFVAIKDLIGQIIDLANKMSPTVDALIAENGPADDSPEADAAEEEIERARYAVLMSQSAQLCGAASGLQSLVANLRYDGWGYYSEANTATLRHELDLLEVS